MARLVGWRKRLLAPCLLVSLAVCLSSLASGQNLSVNPSNLAFQVQQGGSPSPAQLLQVTSSPTGQGFSAQVQVTIVGNNWFKLDRTSGTTPAAIAVTVDPAFLGAGERNANILVSLNGADETAIISVTVVVSTGGNGGGGGGDNPSIGVDPGALTFGASAQGVNPPPQALAVRNTGSGTLSYALEVIYPGQGPTGWLQLSTTFGTSTGSPSTHQVSADVAGLPAGQYSATIRITGNAANSPRQVPVALTIGSAPTILLEPADLEFSGFEGGTNSATQTLRISSAGTSGLSYHITTNQPWLSVFPASGNTAAGPRLHDIGVDLNGLTAGTFLALVSVESAAAGNSPQTALVTLAIHPPGLLSASPTSFSFFGPTGIPIRERKILSLFSASLQGFSWTATVSPPQATWLQLSPTAGGVPGNLFVEVDNTGLAAGPKTAEIHITPVSADASPLATSPSAINQGTPAVTIPVSLVLQSQGPVLDAAPAALSFSASETIPEVLEKSLAVRNNGGPELRWAAIPETEGDLDWLSISPAGGIAPTLTRISVDTSGLSAGTHQGGIAIEAGPQKVTVPVSVVVSPPGGVLTTAQTGVLFDTVQGTSGLAAPVLFVMNSGTDSLAWEASVREAGATGWLDLGFWPGRGPAPPRRFDLTQSISLFAGQSSLLVGTHTALVEIRPEFQGSPRFVTVVLNVRPANETPTVGFSLSKPFFVSPPSTTVLGTRFNVSRNRDGQIGFQAAASTFDGGAWLIVAPASGLTSLQGTTTLTLNVRPAGLAGGVYQGLIGVTLGNGIVQSVPVSLVVTPDSGCISSGAQLASVSPFQNYMVLAGLPAKIEAFLTDAVCGRIVGNGSVLVEFSNGDPAMHLKHVNDGRYVGTWVPGRAAPQVNVRLTASADPWVAETTIVGTVTSTSAPILSTNGTVNGASFARGEPLAPGGIISSFGFNLAPGNFAATLVPLPDSLGGLTLLAGGRPAPLYFAGAGQVNAQLPFETEPGVTQLIARVNGRYSVPQEAVVAAARPGVFLLVSGGTPARAIAQNQDSSLNAPDNPAFRGEALVLYLTGLGAVSPPVLTGAPATNVEPLARADLDATATIGDEAAELLFLGLTPDFVGLGQANILVSPTTPIGPDVPIVVTINGHPSNPAVIAIADQP